MAKFFINRPIVAMVIAILMVIIGIVAMLGLPVAQWWERTRSSRVLPGSAPANPQVSS